MKKGLGTIIIVALLLLTFVASAAESQDSALSDEAQKCLSCHSQRGLIKTFENKDFLEAYVDAEKFRISAHNLLNVQIVILTFRGKHPQRRFRS